MKLIKLATSALGGASTVVNTASTLAILVGAIYLVDCRLTSKTSEGRDSCYFSALTIAGIGAAGKGGYIAGFNTLNPALRTKDETTPERENNWFHRKES